ncbi:MAG: 7-cyano-7-deazaguanine synthase [Nanoarchaeota archaeon]|nr:7-cyano-7-deazaguanine synthase [Nanoarchaeota archaeon]
MDVIVLTSGGIDSAVVCKLIEKQSDKILPLFIDYGQLAAEKEWIACQNIMKDCNLPLPEKMDVRGYGKVIPSGLTSSDKHIYEDAFLPGRNLLFLTLASSYAASKKIKAIAIGLLTEKTHLFPDQTEEFIVNTNFAINSALGDSFMILTPLIKFSKSDVIKLAEKYGIPLDKTYSCHSGKEKYCGKCVACKEILGSELKHKIPQLGECD